MTYPMIPVEAVEAAHEPSPKWSALYDTYQCSICRTWIYKDADTGGWKHGGGPK